MSENKGEKLRALKLSAAEKEAIAELVESDGFKIWKNKIIPHREVQIALTLVSMGTTDNDLWWNKGMAHENAKQVKILEDIAAQHNKNPED